MCKAQNEAEQWTKSAGAYNDRLYWPTRECIIGSDFYLLYILYPPGVRVYSSVYREVGPLETRPSCAMRQEASTAADLIVVVHQDATTGLCE